MTVLTKDEALATLRRSGGGRAGPHGQQQPGRRLPTSATAAPARAASSAASPSSAWPTPSPVRRSSTPSTRTSARAARFARMRASSRPSRFERDRHRERVHAASAAAFACSPARRARSAPVRRPASRVLPPPLTEAEWRAECARCACQKVSSNNDRLTSVSCSPLLSSRMYCLVGPNLLDMAACSVLDSRTKGHDGNEYAVARATHFADDPKPQRVRDGASRTPRTAENPSGAATRTGPTCHR